MSKIRLDLLLIEKKLADNQEQAKRKVMAGLVYSDQLRMDKPGMMVDESLSLTVKQKENPYVGRGGFKLEKALHYFNLNINGKTMVDVGSSTGGFTDCALQNGVKLSYAIDVGYNQLDWKLRNDKRVVVMERTNFRYVTPGMLIEEIPNFATIDVSFISLKVILPVLKTILEKESDIVALIKPQFEAKKEQVGHKGVVRDEQVHIEVLKNIIRIAGENGFKIHDLTFSPITGGDGNIEFLAYFKNLNVQCENDAINSKIEEIVTKAHKELSTTKSN